MNDFEVMQYKESLKEKVILCCETVSNDRFIIKQISLKDAVVLVKFADGTIAQTQMLREILGFGESEIRKAQNYLLKL